MHITGAMDPEGFRIWGKRMVDFVADYWSNMRELQPLHNVQPGYMRNFMPQVAPEEPQSWEEIFADLPKYVVEGNTHWYHPHFFAYYMSGCSYASVMGDILSAGLGSLGFTWNTSPPLTELEMGVVDWLAKMLKLPKYFLNNGPGQGAGLIQHSSTETIITAMLTARNQTAKSEGQFSYKYNKVKGSLMSKLVAYCSDQAHICVDKAAVIAGVRLRKLKSTKNFALSGSTFRRAVEEDLKKGLVPFFICATLGTTGCCAFDNIISIGKICIKFGIYFHIDAAYAGSAFICPEYRPLLNGVEYADSISFNPGKFLMVNVDCAVIWYKNAHLTLDTFKNDAEYIKHRHMGILPDYRHLQMMFCQRFRALKLWLAIRSIGITGLQKHIRTMCGLAQEFACLVSSDKRFEIMAPVVLGLVAFRLTESNELNERLHKAIDDDRRIHLVTTMLKGKYTLRFAICSQMTNSHDIKYAWDVITELTDKIMKC